MKPRYPAMRWSLVAIVCVVAGCSHPANVAGNLPCQGATASSCNAPVAPSTAPPMPPPPPIDTPYAYVGYHDTGSTGPLAAPAAALWGDAPPLVAAVSGATISGGNPPYSASGAMFPALVTGLQFSPTSVSPAPITHDATATVIDPNDVDPCEGNYTSLQLAIPSAGVNTIIYVYHGPSSSNGSPDALSYIALGFWSAGHNNNSVQKGAVGVFLLGYETPFSAMPTSGQGSYSGQVSGLVYAPINGHVTEAYLAGKANLSADFAFGTVTGAFTGIRYDGGYTDGTANQPQQHVGGP